MYIQGKGFIISVCFYFSSFLGLPCCVIRFVIEPLHSQNHQICCSYFSTVVQLQSIIMTPSCCSHRLFPFLFMLFERFVNALRSLCERM